jgi:hypothetical protein
MTGTSANAGNSPTQSPSKPPLGVGTLLQDSFSILFRHFFPIVIIGFVPSLLGVIISGNLVGFEAVISMEDSSVTGSSTLTGLVDLMVYSVTTIFLVQLAYDAKLQRPVQIVRYIKPALTSLFPVVIMSLIVGLLIGLAAFALLIPALWVAAVYSVMEPAVVIERAGFRGMARSVYLTKEYRWPIAGALILGWLCVAVIIIVAMLVVDLVMQTENLVASVVIFAALTSVGTGLVSLLTALIYARLREIKEGVSVDEIAAVFD